MKYVLLLENDFFGFSKVKWQQYTGKVGKCIQAIDVKFSQDLTHGACVCCVRCVRKNSTDAKTSSSPRNLSSRRKSCRARSTNGRFGIAFEQLFGSQVSSLLCSLSVCRGSLQLNARKPSTPCKVAASLLSKVLNAS